MIPLYYAKVRVYAKRRDFGAERQKNQAVSGAQLGFLGF
jgi:hypothetical protein